VVDRVGVGRGSSDVVVEVGVAEVCRVEEVLEGGINSEVRSSSKPLEVEDATGAADDAGVSEEGVDRATDEATPGEEASAAAAADGLIERGRTKE